MLYFSLLWAALSAAVPARAQSLRTAPAPDVGVLILAHGGDASWDAEIGKIKAELAKRGSAVEVALGMADSAAIQKAADALQARKVKRIVVVPLFICSVSEVMDQNNYLFGLRDKPSEALMAAAHGHMNMMGGMDKIKLKVPFEMKPALDDSPLVTEILADRVRAMSRDPRREAVLLVAHGPVSDAYNQKWLAMMRVHADRLKQQLGLAAADVASLRDDAASDVRAQAVDQMRGAVRRLEREGKVLVVPLLLAKGGIEQKIPKDLEGTFFTWRGDTLAPHPKLVDWVVQTVEGKSAAPAPKRKAAKKAPKRAPSDVLAEPQESPNAGEGGDQP